MDEYLIEGASFCRLAKEYKQYNSLVIAYDFDSTVYDFHNKGENYDMVIQLLRDLKAVNCYLICFTASENIDMIRDYLTANNIPCDTINENPPFFKSSSSKVYYNAFLDDRAGLIQVYDDLCLLLKYLKKDEI